MPSTEFIHTAQFFQTIFSFSLLILISQQFISIWKQLNDKYISMKIKQYNEEQQWLKDKLNISSQPTNAQYSNKAQLQNGQEKLEQKPQLPKQQNLRTSLVENQHDQTDRKIYQNQSQYNKNNYQTKNIDQEKNQQRRSSNKRKSLTDLRKQQIKNQQQQIEIKDQSDVSVSRKASINSQKGIQSYVNDNNNKLQNKSRKSSGIQKRLQKFNDPNYQQPSVVNSNYSDNDGQYRKQIKAKFKIQVLKQIDVVFDQHLAILIPLLILGIIVHSTYIFIIVCFFGYVFSHVLMNYTGNQFHQEHNQQQGIFSRKKLGKIIPKVWIIAIFISYWADSQFS